MITLQDITIRRGTKVVLDAASVTIHPGEKARSLAATVLVSQVYSRC